MAAEDTSPLELWEAPDAMHRSAEDSVSVARPNSGLRATWAGLHRRSTFRWLLAGLALLGLVTWLASRNRTTIANSSALEPLQHSSPETVLSAAGDGDGQKIVVDVHGDVVHPGVYALGTDSRVRDAIKAAGGLLHPEDAQFVNSAAPLDDGQEVVIPGPDVAGQPSLALAANSALATGAADSTSAPTSTARIDINTASQATLETLPGIGPSRADAMIQYRQEHGGFKSPDELQNIPGIGPKTWAKLAPYVYVQSSHGQKP